MPGMSGAQLARTLAGEFPDLPVILATGYAEVSDEDQALCPNRLTKPFRFEELAAALASVLQPPGHAIGQMTNVVRLKRGARPASPA